VNDVLLALEYLSRLGIWSILVLVIATYAARAVDWLTGHRR
jgi:hypothetical protein